MKIKTLQAGGMAPFMSYTPNVGLPQVEQPTQQSLASKEESQGSGLLSKEMIKILMEEALPSDSEAFMASVGQMEQDIASGIGPTDSSQIYNSLITKMGKLKFNKEQAIKARDILYANGGMNEVAITVNGGVINQGEKGMEVISIDQYKKDPSKYNLATNNELEKMRAYDTRLAFNNNIVGILQNGQGTEEVTKQIQSVISQMAKQSTTREGFADPSQLKALKGVEAMTGIVKVTMTKESEATYKEFAKEYLYNMLPTNSKNLLRVKAAQRGCDIKDIMEMLIVPSTANSEKEEYDISDTSAGKNGGGSGSSKTADLTFADSWVANDLGEQKNYVFNMGENYQIEVPAYKVTGFIDAAAQKMLPIHSSIADIANKALSTIGDVSNVYLGNKKIDPKDLNRIIASGESNAKAYLPLDQKARAKGEIKPDLELAGKLKVVADDIKSKKADNNEALKRSIYKQHGMEAYYGDVVSNPNFASFAMINAAFQGEGFKDDSNKKYFKEVEDDDVLRDRLNEAIAGKGLGEKVSDVLYADWNPTVDNEIYEGLIYIHTIDDPAMANLSGNYSTVPAIRKDRGHMIQAQYENRRELARNNAQTKTSILHGGN